MIYVDKLLQHPDFLLCLNIIEKKERTRRFCRHGLDHALDVARIAWIICLENQLTYSKETIYLAALLHDLGRSAENARHEEESVKLARYLLTSCGATTALIDQITDAISQHRKKNQDFIPQTASLGELLSYADKKSRLCFRCAAANDCYWDPSLKNNSIRY